MSNITQYQLLSSVEREEISRELAQGKEISAIARRLGRASSTISREVNRNSSGCGYRAFFANNRAKVLSASRRKGKRRLVQEANLRAYVLEKLLKRWSPNEIVKCLKEL